MKIAVFVGTRPEIIKMQPIVKEIEKRRNAKLFFVHTGQHYDWNMSGEFLKELRLPNPIMFLNVKSGSQGTQIARIIMRSERALAMLQPDVVSIQGDTNSALGVALAASRLNIPIAHVEAGCRSFDKRMPEEKNRTLIAVVASLHFAPTSFCKRNLLQEGITKNNIFLTGHPIVDVLSEFRNRITNSALTHYNLRPKGYYFLTIHREENVTNEAKLSNILAAILELSKTTPIIFPVHPRTRKQLRKLELSHYLENVSTTEPLGYFETLGLIKNARIVLTDSGGIQQEAALLKTPCVTLRESTEWVETVDCGVNILADSEQQISSAVHLIENNGERITYNFRSVRTVFGGPHVARKMVDILEQRACS